MEKIIIFLCCYLTVCTYTKAQCNEEVALTSTKAEAVDSAGKILRHEDVPVTIVITKTNVTITPNNDENGTLKGDITAVACNWKTPFKDGTERIKANLEDARGDLKHAILTIKAKDAVITMLLQAEERPNENMLVHIDKYELK